MAVDFKAKQAEFASYIRDPAANPAPVDVDPQRMEMYRQLFFNNLDSFLSSNFPVLRTILSDKQWLALTQDFFAGHSCRTPYFSEIAEEFLAYLQNRTDSADDLPFMLELAHYEWVEMALDISKAESHPGDATFAEQVLLQELALSALAWPLAYRYPVQRIAPDFLPIELPEHPTYLIVYRDKAYHVHFVQTTPLTFRLLEILEQNPGISGESCLQTLATEMELANPALLLEQGETILQDMAAKGIVIPAGYA